MCIESHNSVFHSIDWQAEGRALAAGRDCLAALAARGWIAKAEPDFPQFLRRFEEAQGMSVPLTAFTPMACWWLYEIGFRHGPCSLAGMGTYCALGWSFLAAGAADRHSPDLVEALAIDVDPGATELARANLARMRLPGAVAITDDALRWLRSRTKPIDLLFLDLDDPSTGKAGYSTAFLDAVPLLAPGACLVAHDGCCPRFARDVADLAEAILATPGWSEPILLPVDHAGLLIAFQES